MDKVVIDGVEFRRVEPASGRRVVCLTHGWTWVGDYSENGSWVVLRNAQNVESYKNLGIGGAINDPSASAVTLGAPLECEMRIPLAAVIWTAEVPQCR